MSDNPDIEELLQQLNNTLTSLDKYGDIDTLIDKLDAKNRKQLKKVKNIVWDINSRVGNIKDKVSKAYKRVKVRITSESNQPANIEDVSDREIETLSNGSLEASIEEADRYSPAIRRKGRRAKKSSKENLDEIKDKEEDSDDSETQTNDENQEDEVLAKTNKESEQPIDVIEKTISDESSDESVVEATPEKSQNKKLLLTFKKSQDNTGHEVIDTSTRTGMEENEEHPKTNKEQNETSNDDNAEDSSIDIGEKQNKQAEDSTLSDSEKIMDEGKQNNEEENSIISNSGKSKRNINEDNEKENSEENSDEVEQDKKEEEEPNNDLVKSTTNKKKKTKDNKLDDLGTSTEKTKNNRDKEEENVQTDTEEAEKKLEDCEESNKEIEDVLKPKIKLIDISKLLAPNTKPMIPSPSPSKHQKSVTFDRSVIILSSSDEDTPKKSPIGKENDITPLKSALRKTTSKSKIIELSDSDSDVKRNSKKLSSDESDFEYSSRSRRVRGRNREVKKKFSNLKKARDEKKLKESLRDTRRSKRNLKINRKELLEESSLSDDDDDSSFEVVQKSTKKRTWSSRSKKTDIKETNFNDPKLKLPVIIRLPKFPTEDLPEIYKNKKELLEIKNLCKISSSLGSSTIRKKKEIKEDDTSDDEKLETKRIKLTLKINKKNLENEKKSSDDEPSGTDDNDNVEMDNDVDMLDSVRNSESQDAGEVEGLKASLEQLKDSDEEMNRSKDGAESDEETSAQKDTNNEKSSDKEQGEEKDEGTKVNGKLSDSEDGSDKDKEANEEFEKSKNDNHEEEEESSQKKKTKKKENAQNVGEEAAHSSDDTDEETDNKGKKILTIESSSDEDAPQSKAGLKSGPRKRVKKKLMSDSDLSDNDRNSDDNFKATNSNSSTASSKSNSDNDEEPEEEPQSKSRKRIKKLVDSSSDEEDKSTRKALRRMIDRDSLSQTTLKAEAEEKARKARILEKQNKYNKIFELKSDAVVDKVVLDFDEKTNKPLLSVHKKLVKHLKPHQVLGIKFMWDACFESLDRACETKGSGCILAHCMGLGKTLQVIALAHTLLKNQEKTKVERILVVCPVNTVINWKNEFKKWMPKSSDFDIYELVSCKTSSVNQERNYIVKCWQDDGGVLIIGYNMFRTLSNPDNKTLSKKLRLSFQSGLVDPGPDLVICDEGHLLKNEKTNLSIAMNRIKTARRIVLTGTPLQNNLREYWCMVQFIKPNLLGTYKEYLNRFVNPITNGQYTDSTQHDIMVMRRRSHVLHKLLDGVVQRQDYEVLAPYLPPKYEYVIFLKLTDVQIKLYQHYIDNLARQNDGSNKTSFLFADFQQLQRICTHPRVLLDKSNEDRDKKEKNGDESEESEGSIADFIDDDSDSAESTPDESSNSDSDGSNASDSSPRKKKKEKNSERTASRRKTRMTRAQAAQKRKAGEVISVSDTEEDNRPKEWWEQYIAIDELDNINHSSKMFLLFQLLKECEEIGDKILVFSQSLYTLNSIEYFLARIDDATQSGEPEKVGGYSGSWSIGLDYFRLDGSSSCENRAGWCDEFNNPNNTRARLFLISTKAGGLGINLVAANRVIIFDVSWNPSHDIQSIYRVYRFGQTKPSYIYRFVTHGAMEMKIYERQVTKQAISKRVIDEQQIDRHYSQNDIQELYKTDLEPKEERPIPRVPKDVLLGEMLQKYDKTIYKYHEHQTLLENKQDEELNEEERKAAWDEFENEKVIRKTAVANFGNTNLGAINSNFFTNINPRLIQGALINIMRKDNPTWSDYQIKGVVPALVTQLQMQMAEQDYRLYTRVSQEIQMMQSVQMQQAYFQQLQMKQQQYEQQQFEQQHLQRKQKSLNPYLITPEELRLLQMGQEVPHNSVSGQARAGGSGMKSVASSSNRAFASSASGSSASTSAANKSNRAVATSASGAASNANKNNDIIELND